MYQKNRGFPGFLLTLAAGPGLHCHSHSIEGRQGPGQVIACVSHATADSQPPRGHPDMKFRHTLAASVALIPVALLSTPAFAQSTGRSEEHTSELQSLMRISYAVFCLKKKKIKTNKQKHNNNHTTNTPTL